MPTQTSAAPRQLGDGNTQGLMVGPAKDSSGNAAKIGFLGTTPIALPTPAGYTTMQTAGSTTSLFINTATTGGVGTTQFTFGDVVAALKSIGLLVQ